MTNKGKEVLVDFEEKMTLTNAAEYFEAIAKKLKEEGSFTLTHNGQPVEIKPSSTIELEIKVEKQTASKNLKLSLNGRKAWKTTH